MEFGSIVPSRGIRQGDPLSSYLSLICMEGLSAIIHNFEQKKLIKGIRVARGAPVMSHMLFADDSYIFCQANMNTTKHIVDMLQLFEKASGQQLNAAKSSVFFSVNMVQEERDLICNTLKFHEADDNTTYLGLPNTIGRNKSAMLGYLKNRMQSRIDGFDKKVLSKGGK